ncbi:energy-coupling factor transporter ATPase [Selenomonas sp. WCA-380-WT-3B 3/]|uniref:Energy-coupling factor transporter ATP-binding protein EcfA2 n=1 Tax=Selenomonas montiformis TaxID=2652285 RepID=A0A6I2UU85_9FIRM|nr:energy-coupling factor transporter ATPase [Selenomonas montiformis]MSV23915.1 energy-coupling factor transporter ATPase [Selenomonas montiformis]
MSIELKEVTYCYMPGTPYERYALRQVSVSIQDGSFTAIAGHTGSGKSTLVQHLNGLLQPSSGQVLVDGIDLKGSDKEARAAAKAARRRVGMVFQYPEQQLFEETVEKDVAFGPKNQGLDPGLVQGRVEEAMNLVGLDYASFRNRSPFQLSGGQKRRAAIAGVLALHPRYLVLDEPTAGLDPCGREDLIRMIQKLHRDWKLTIVFISHSMEDVARLADSVILMNHGECVIQDDPDTVFSRDDLLQAAGLRPPHIQRLLRKLQAAGVPVQTRAKNIEECLARIREGLKHAQ